MPTAWFEQLLVCPRHRLPLRREGDELVCQRGDRFPVVDGIPVLLIEEMSPTHPNWWTRPQHVALARISPEALDPDSKIFVESEIVATCGLLYVGVGALARYPIPDLRLPPTDGALFLDIGGNWGRWSIAAAREGYRAICLDPSLRAALAGKRIARELGVEVAYVVADARQLPLRNDAVDLAFSYSVLQGLSRPNVRDVLSELRRVVRPDGRVRVQMANIFGVRQAYNYARQATEEFGHRIREGHWPERWIFRVRPWTVRGLRHEFSRAIGPTEISVEGFFSLNAQAADIDLLPRHMAAVVRVSDALRHISERAPGLAHLADSVYVDSINAKSN
jgi:SAM-dependent methyltransferase/uncharacterized protein YbaR (Trm112 family)